MRLTFLFPRHLTTILLGVNDGDAYLMDRVKTPLSTLLKSVVRLGGKVHATPLSKIRTAVRMGRISIGEFIFIEYEATADGQWEHALYVQDCLCL